MLGVFHEWESLPTDAGVAWPLPDIFWSLLLKADVLTCVSVTRRFDLRASGPTALRWQDSDVGLEQRRQLIFELGKHGHKKQSIIILNIKYYIKICNLKYQLFTYIILKVFLCPAFELGKHGHIKWSIIIKNVKLYELLNIYLKFNNIFKI